MREVKFRGKRLDNGEWIVGSYIEAENRDRSIAHQIIPYKAGLVVREVDPATVGQYTGLKDNKSTEIYEGDIVQLDYITTCGKHRIGLSFEVRWSTQDGCWFGWDGFVGNALQQMHKMFVVKGNIHDNPELLKTE